jgi:hypothetical protein
VVVPSSTQAQRRLKRLEREVPASYATLRDTVRVAQQREYFCRADAAAAAESLRMTPSAYHQGEGQVEERPKYGKGRPSTRLPRPVQERRYGLTATLTEHATRRARQRAEADCFVLLTNGPMEGTMAHRAEEVRRVYKEQQGIEQHYGFLKAPLLVSSLFVKKAERIELTFRTLIHHCEAFLEDYSNDRRAKAITRSFLPASTSGFEATFALFTTSCKFRGPCLAFRREPAVLGLATG